MIELLIVGLFITLCVQQAFWMRNVQRLVDKSMSRSYPEYAYVESLKKPKVKLKDASDINIQDDYATEQAERANKTFGLI